MLISNAEFVTSVVRMSDLPLDRPHIALFGRSNVGKSSLINSLCGQKSLSRTSAIPGRTQTVNVFRINHQFYLIDLPGYGYAKTAKSKKEAFQNLIIDYIDSDAPIRLAVLITDSRHEPMDQDLAMIESLKGRGIPVAIIANKIDKLSNSELSLTKRKLHERFSNDLVIGYSSETKAGRSELLQAIDAHLKS
jgi:GTP-binding protein